MGRLTHAEGIQINESGDSRPEYIGATKQSNNTAELTALYRALWRANKRPKDAPPETIYTDSLYARNITLGVWKGSKRTHRRIIRNLRNVWKQVQKRRGMRTVSIEHIRSHIGWPGNELADQAASAAMHEISDEAATLSARAKTKIRAPSHMKLQSVTLNWARAQLRATIGSNQELHPPPQPHVPLQPPTHPALHPRTGDG